MQKDIILVILVAFVIFFWIENILIKSGIFNLPGKKDLTKNKGTNNNLLAIDATETPIERIKKN
ncbi:hypothetical protein [Spiroplasma endosymbiont of Zeiraphera isertana]|uniref:hypothetical protein n=1 Tax=Spiroplasma endosymbiont of Zeiraphera isertana TaxID=3066313 RepID=UPI00313F1CBE